MKNGYTGLKTQLLNIEIYRTSRLTLPLGYSAIFDLQRNIMEFIVEKVNVDAVDALGETALHVSCQHNCFSSVDLILRHKGDPNIKSLEGITALHYAAEFGDLDLVKLLIASGAKIDSIDNVGRTVLHAAALNRNYTEPLEYFLKLQVFDVNCQDFDGNTPLHGIYPQYGYFEQELLYESSLYDPPSWTSPGTICKNFLLLLQHDANVNIKNKFHKTPYHADGEVEHDCPVLYHLIKIHLLGYEVNEETICHIHGYDNPEISNPCKKELESLKNSVISCFPNSITLYDLLIMKSHRVMRYLNNANLLKFHASTDEMIEEQFPHYGSWLRKKLQRTSKKMNLQNSATKILDKLFGEQLPDDICGEIFKYLTTKNLEILLQVEDELKKFLQ